MAVAALLGAGGRVECRQAMDALFEPRAGGLLIAVSHDGRTKATIAALEAAAAAGAQTALITARPDAQMARHVLVTPMIDRSWCHTVAYLSTILAGVAIGGHVSGNLPNAAALTKYLRALAAIDARGIAKALAKCSRVIVAGAGVDLISARELSLKIEEGARIPTTALHLETVLHGHLAACGKRTGLVLILTDSPGGQRRDQRAASVAAAAHRIGMPVAAIVTGDSKLLVDLAGAGRITLPAGGYPLAGAAVALQRLTLALVHEVGVNPDLIRREQKTFREAARIAESSHSQ